MGDWLLDKTAAMEGELRPGHRVLWNGAGHTVTNAGQDDMNNRLNPHLMPPEGHVELRPDKPTEKPNDYANQRVIAPQHELTRLPDYQAGDRVSGSSDNNPHWHGTVVRVDNKNERSQSIQDALAVDPDRPVDYDPTVWVRYDKHGLTPQHPAALRMVEQGAGLPADPEVSNFPDTIPWGDDEQDFYRNSRSHVKTADINFDDAFGEAEPQDFEGGSKFYKFAVHPERQPLFWQTKNWDSRPHHFDKMLKDWYRPEEDRLNEGPHGQISDLTIDPGHATGTIDVSPDGQFGKLESYRGRQIRSDMGDEAYQQALGPVIQKFQDLHPGMPLHEQTWDESLANTGFRRLADAANPDQWGFLNDHVGFGSHHHQIIEQLARAQNMNDFDVRRLANYAMVNRVPQGIEHHIAWGHMEKGYPAFWRSNVDRNHVWDKVTQAHEKLNQSYTQEKRPEFNPLKVIPVTDDRWEDGTGIGAGTDGGMQSGDRPAGNWLTVSAINDGRLDELVLRAQSEGGFTVNSDLSDAPPTGYFTAYDGGQEIPANQFGPGDIAQIQASLGPGDLIGAWVDRGIVYLDRSRRFESEPEAQAFGASQNQLSIYDGNTGQVIPVQGSDWTPEAPERPQEPRAASVHRIPRRWVFAAQKGIESPVAELDFENVSLDRPPARSLRERIQARALAG